MEKFLGQYLYGVFVEMKKAFLSYGVAFAIGVIVGKLL
jgi:hypothetical protein